MKRWKHSGDNVHVMQYICYIYVIYMLYICYIYVIYMLYICYIYVIYEEHRRHQSCTKILQYTLHDSEYTLHILHLSIAEL